MKWQELPDRRLVELCLERREDAWVEFLRRYHRLMAGVAANTILHSRLQPTASSVQDLTQDVIARVCANEFRPLRQLEWRHEGSLRGLLQVTASTVAQDYVRNVRAKKRDITKEESLEETGLVGPTGKKFTDSIEHKILLEQLARCLSKLLRGEPESTRDIAMFLLYYGCKVTAPDLSRLYHLNVRKVENTLARIGRFAKSHCI